MGRVERTRAGTGALRGSFPQIGDRYPSGKFVRV